MNRIIACICLCLFILQIGVKSMIALYYQTFDTKTAKENCEYKSMTICKGSCFVTKQIKIVSSSSNKESQPVQQIDLNSLKDVIGISTNFDAVIPAGFFQKSELNTAHSDRYSYTYTTCLIKPPIV